MTDPAQAFLNHGNVDNSSSRFGGVSHYEWVFARPWDGSPNTGGGGGGGGTGGGAGASGRVGFRYLI